MAVVAVRHRVRLRPSSAVTPCHPSRKGRSRQRVRARINLYEIISQVLGASRIDGGEYNTRPGGAAVPWCACVVVLRLWA